MHAQRVNISSEMIRGIGIRILDGVNEMLPVGIVSTALDERNAEDRAASRAFIDINAKLRKKLIGVYQQARMQSYFHSQNNAISI